LGFAASAFVSFSVMQHPLYGRRDIFGVREVQNSGKERNGATLADTDAAMPRIPYIMHLSASRHKACASLQSLAVIRHDNRQFLFLWWAAGYSWQCVEWKSAEGVSPFLRERRRHGKI